MSMLQKPENINKNHVSKSYVIVSALHTDFSACPNVLSRTASCKMISRAGYRLTHTMYINCIVSRVSAQWKVTSQDRSLFETQHKQSKVTLLQKKATGRLAGWIFQD